MSALAANLCGVNGKGDISRRERRDRGERQTQKSFFFLGFSFLGCSLRLCVLRVRPLLLGFSLRPPRSPRETSLCHRSRAPRLIDNSQKLRCTKARRTAKARTQRESVSRLSSRPCFSPSCLCAPDFSCRFSLRPPRSPRETSLCHRSRAPRLIDNSQKLRGTKARRTATARAQRESLSRLSSCPCFSPSCLCAPDFSCRFPLCAPRTPRSPRETAFVVGRKS